MIDRFIKWLVVIAAFATATVAQAETVTCVFKENVAVLLGSSGVRVIELRGKTKLLIIEDQKTPAGILRLDGARKATSSRNWDKARVAAHGDFVLIGDNGDRLTVTREQSRAGKFFAASLARSTGRYAFALIGGCKFEPKKVDDDAASAGT